MRGWGACPDSGRRTSVAILIPIAFLMGLGPTLALILLTSAYCGTMYGRRISSILLNIPGDESVMTSCLDGLTMVQKGQASESLTLSGIASSADAFFATWGLILLAPQLLKIALLFGPAEYFVLHSSP